MGPTQFLVYHYCIGACGGTFSNSVQICRLFVLLSWTAVVCVADLSVKRRGEGVSDGRGDGGRETGEIKAERGGKGRGGGKGERGERERGRQRLVERELCNI